MNTLFLRVDQLFANAWNPNRMEPGEFSQLVTEIRRLGRVAKPIVVRRVGDDYEIVDGEHNWRAAKEVGLAEVPCEVVDVDDFEARRQTLKRNQHGTHDSILEGQMFREMMALHDLSGRGLAQEIDISEAAVRNALLYAEAAEVRNHCAPSSGNAEISSLTVPQVRMYRNLASGIRDAWLDAGGELELLEIACMASERTPVDASKVIAQHELAHAVSSDPDEFGISFHRVLDVVEWIEDHGGVDNILPYVEQVITHGLPGDSLGFLLDSNGAVSTLVTPEEWAELVRAAASDDSAGGDQTGQLLTAIGALLRHKGISLTDERAPTMMSILVELNDAPDVIREAPLMTIQEKVIVARQLSDGEPEMVLETQRRTCQKVAELRGAGNDDVDVMKVFVEVAVSLFCPQEEGND